MLFELIGARYEQRSMLIIANQPFADWNKVFPDHAMMIAAIDRLVHHSIIFDMAGTQSWCSTRACRSMPTPPAYISIQSIGARFGSLEKCLVFSAAVSKAFCRARRLRNAALRHIRDTAEYADPISGGPEV